ncbi:hypothetical protein [Aeromonas caviae]|uniref:hypothetical protein n=1 Tax=Aeromonas caviae TaxID=648 RepID=UPI002B4627EB|nr:hypothetical protein [Aeromonas caviae]
MLTYTQDIKEQSRIEVWSRAVRKLTVDREKQKILDTNYIRRLWDYAFDEQMKNCQPEERFIDSWVSFSNGLYSSKSPQQLKIAYLCGPEPENDLSIMLELGIQIENVWAIEADTKSYSAALKSVRDKYPTLKIFKGAIAQLMSITSFKFDIIYLDFTAPLFSKEAKPLLTINAVFEHDALSDLGILVINSSLPEKTDENINFLASYFRSHPFLENSIYSGDMSDSFFVEGADCHGYISDDEDEDEDEDDDDDDKSFKELIKQNFECAYNAFSTHYPTIMASYIQPILRVGNNTTLKNMFFSKSDVNIKNSIVQMETMPDYENEELPKGGEVFENHEDYPIWNFLIRLKDSEDSLSKYWHQQFITKNKQLSVFDGVKHYDLLRTAKYSYEDILSEDLSKSINKVIHALKDPHGGVFCDVPLPHLWIELALNHLGNAYHANTNSHWRAKYKAKTRDMYLDLFVFDNCRALYEWLPMINLYGEDMSTVERQIIVRACMDAITKQNHHSSFFSYYGANLIGVGTKRWADFGELQERHDLNELYENELSQLLEK